MGNSSQMSRLKMPADEELLEELSKTNSRGGTVQSLESQESKIQPRVAGNIYIQDENAYFMTLS